MTQFNSHSMTVFATEIRFCLSNVITYRQTFLDLVNHATIYIKRNIRRVCSPPPTSAVSFARAILDLALAKRLNKEDGNSTALAIRVQWFLTLFNGDWKDHSKEGLVHHCSVRCPCGCLDISQLAEAASQAYVEIVLASRPPVPALSRWLKCSDTGKWFILAMSCHGVFQAAFKSIFNKDGKKPSGKKASANAALILSGLLGDEAYVQTGDDSGNLPLPAGESPFTCPDVPVGRVQGLRAAKSESWLDRPETATEILVAILATQPVYELSCHFMEEQKHQSWLSDDPRKRPLTSLATERYSPVVDKLVKYLNVLETPVDAESIISLLCGNLAPPAGHVSHFVLFALQAGHVRE